jgi:hypothetical protein
MTEDHHHDQIVTVLHIDGPAITPDDTTTVDPVEQRSWGIIRYAPGSGAVCEDDAAGFDGWYAHREEALAVARNWVSQYPRRVVALVSSDLIWFGLGDFTTVRHLPLTAREVAFAARAPMKPRRMRLSNLE